MPSFDAPVHPLVGVLYVIQTHQLLQSSREPSRGTIGLVNELVKRLTGLFGGEGVHHRAEDTGNSERPSASSTMSHNQKDLVLNLELRWKKLQGDWCPPVDGVKKTAALESSTTTPQALLSATDEARSGVSAHWKNKNKKKGKTGAGNWARTGIRVTPGDELTLFGFTIPKGASVAVVIESLI
ncbi:hypothetical protein EDB83DRAFT_2322469 [Lactarius deliciosus]|nr:hypothetical protein EDB83DRAFT_2322469 [Lactarius deliciosus]